MPDILVVKVDEWTLIDRAISPTQTQVERCKDGYNHSCRMILISVFQNFMLISFIGSFLSSQGLIKHSFENSKQLKL